MNQFSPGENEIGGKTKSRLRRIFIKIKNQKNNMYCGGQIPGFLEKIHGIFFENLEISGNTCDFSKIRKIWPASPEKTAFDKEIGFYFLENPWPARKYMLHVFFKNPEICQNKLINSAPGRTQFFSPGKKNGFISSFFHSKLK